MCWFLPELLLRSMKFGVQLLLAEIRLDNAFFGIMFRALVIVVVWMWFDYDVDAAAQTYIPLVNLPVMVIKMAQTWSIFNRNWVIKICTEYLHLKLRNRNLWENTCVHVEFQNATGTTKSFHAPTINRSGQLSGLEQEYTACSTLCMLVCCCCLPRLVMKTVKYIPKLWCSVVALAIATISQ